MIGRAFWTIAIGMIIPLIGIVVSQIALGGLTGQSYGVAEFFYGRPTLGQARAACAAGYGSGYLCGEIWGLGLLRQASLWSAAALVAVIVLFLSLASIAGASRPLNAAFFPPLMPFTSLSVAALIFIHGAILTYCVYLVELWLYGRTHIWPPALAGVGALIGATALTATLRSASKDRPSGMLARVVTRQEQPKLWAYVDGVAEKLGARKPRNILVGLDPNFFATAAPVATPEREQPVEGETLYFSLPLMRLFNENELTAVVGHELGHFRGGDTAYSLEFAPVYRTLVEAIHALEGDDGRVDWITAKPGALMLNLMLEAFSRNERRISRDREFEADRAGLEVSNAEGLALSLAKVAVYAPLWHKTRVDNVVRLNQGRISPNLATVFVESARFDVSHSLIGDILARVMTHRIAHPTDTHPPIADRYAAVGFDAKQGLTIEKLTEQGGASDALFDGLEELERALTVIEHKVMLEAGIAQAPEAAPNFDPLLQAAYILAATMVGADGDVEPEEIQMAETIGARLFKDFDPVSFREIFQQLHELPNFDQVAAILDGALTKDNKRRVLAFLLEIAAVDGEIAPGERSLLNAAATRWGIGRPLELRLPGRGRDGGAARPQGEPEEQPPAQNAPSS